MIPTFIYPFLLAVIAVVAGTLFMRRHNGEPNSLVRDMLYAVAAGCVLIGIWLLASQ